MLFQHLMICGLTRPVNELGSCAPDIMISLQGSVNAVVKLSTNQGGIGCVTNG